MFHTQLLYKNNKKITIGIIHKYIAIFNKHEIIQKRIVDNRFIKQKININSRGRKMKHIILTRFNLAINFKGYKRLDSTIPSITP